MIAGAAWVLVVIGFTVSPLSYHGFHSLLMLQKVFMVLQTMPPALVARSGFRSVLRPSAIAGLDAARILPIGCTGLGDSIVVRSLVQLAPPLSLFALALCFSALGLLWTSANGDHRRKRIAMLGAFRQTFIALGAFPVLLTAYQGLACRRTFWHERSLRCSERAGVATLALSCALILILTLFCPLYWARSVRKLGDLLEHSYFELRSGMLAVGLRKHARYRALCWLPGASGMAAIVVGLESWPLARVLAAMAFVATWGTYDVARRPFVSPALNIASVVMSVACQTVLFLFGLLHDAPVSQSVFSRLGVAHSLPIVFYAISTSLAAACATFTAFCLFGRATRRVADSSAASLAATAAASQAQPELGPSTVVGRSRLGAWALQRPLSPVPSRLQVRASPFAELTHQSSASLAFTKNVSGSPTASVRSPQHSRELEIAADIVRRNSARPVATLGMKTPSPRPVQPLERKYSPPARSNAGKTVSRVLDFTTPHGLAAAPAQAPANPTPSAGVPVTLASMLGEAPDSYTSEPGLVPAVRKPVAARDSHLRPVQQAGAAPNLAAQVKAPQAAMPHQSKHKRMRSVNVQRPAAAVIAVRPAAKLRHVPSAMMGRTGLARQGNSASDSDDDSPRAPRAMRRAQSTIIQMPSVFH